MDTEKQNTVGSVHEEMSPTAEVAYLANQEDHETSRLQAIRSNPWAFAWCIFAVWTTLLVSYENQASSTILGIPQFRKDFGSYFDGNYVLPAAWQAAFGGGAVAV
jgi:SP family general alpha glucoside:H+ symporter-like MFS transporter